MSEEKRYNDERWSDLPLPDADKAWQKMEVLLEEDKRRRRILPWWFWRTAAVSLLIIGLLAGGWWWLWPTNKGEKKTNLVKQKQQTNGGQRQAAAIGVNKKSTAERDALAQHSASPAEKNLANLVTPPVAIPPINKPALPQAQKNQQRTTGIAPVKEKQMLYGERKKKLLQKDAPSLPPVKNSKSDGDKAVDEGVIEKKNAGIVLNKEAAGKDSLQQKTLPKKDSTGAKDSVKATAPPVAQTGEKKKGPKKKSSLAFSAGIGLQQAVALQHQPASPVDSLGRKTGFFDYFPSVYAKVQRGKWAAQLEFQYSIPQPVAGFSFSQKTTYDATASVLETERMNLQKLYYHQLSLGVSYYVLPQWSVGMGGVYNIFAGAITEREFSEKYTATGAEAVYKITEPVKGYKDSFFYKTMAGLLLQTDYHWKRFSLGVRYTQNLQPFIKYTQPNGDVMDKKNNALQAVLRFRLWRK